MTLRGGEPALPERTVRVLAAALLKLAAVAVLFSVLIGALDVIGSNILGFRVPGVVIMTQLAMVVIVFAPLTQLELGSENLAVTMLYDRLMGRSRAIVDVVITLASLAFFGLLAYGSVRYLVRSIDRGERTVDLVQLPLWPVKAVLAGSLLLLAGHLIMRLRREIRALTSRSDSSDRT